MIAYNGYVPIAPTKNWLEIFLKGIVFVSNMVVDTTRFIQVLERNDSDAVVEADTAKLIGCWITDLAIQKAKRHN